MKSASNYFTFGGIVLAVIVLMHGNVWGLAAVGEQRMQENKQQHTKLWEKVKQLDQEKGELADVVASIDGLIEEREEEIARIEQQLDEANQRHEQMLQEQEELNRKLEKHRGDLKSRARMIYMQGDLAFLELIFESGSFGDLVDRMFFVQRVIKHDEEMVSDAERMQLELVEKKKAVEAQIKDIDAIHQQLELQLRELEDRKGEKELVLKAMNEDRNLTLRRIKELEEENKRIMAQIRAMQNSPGAYKGKPWTGNFLRPCSGEITSKFGSRKHPIYGVTKMHTGVDIGAPHGTTVKAAGKGKVIFAARKGGYGKTVMVDHGNKRVTLYAHLSRITCKQGDLVDTSTKLGEVGSTGISTGNHLHFEVRIDGEPVNPETAL